MIFNAYTFPRLDDFEELIVFLKMYSDEHADFEFTNSMPVAMNDNTYGFIWPVIEGEDDKYAEVLSKYGTPITVTDQDFVREID